MAKETYRIDIEIEANDNYSSEIDKAKSSVEQLEKAADGTSKSVDKLGGSSQKAAKDVEKIGSSFGKAGEKSGRFEKSLSKTGRLINKVTGGRHELVLRAKDRASRVIRSVGRFASRNIERTYRTTLRAINLGAGVIRGFSRALLSLPTMITVGLGVVGMGSLAKSTVGSAMNFEDYGVSMDHWLKDDKKASKALMKWMGQKADLTPYTSADIFPAMTGAISMVGNDPNKIKRLTSTAIDMAALTPGSSVEDAMQAIQNAQMGEMTMMKRFGFNITKKEFDSMGFDGFVKEIEKSFEGGALRLSKTSRGLINTLKGYAGSQFREIGDGILDGMKPRLEGVVKWLMDNEKAWGKWKATVGNAGRQASEWAFSKLETGFKHIKDNYLENKKFHKLDFEGKIKFIMEDIGKWWGSNGAPALSSWWDNTGEPMAKRLGTSVGKAMVTGIVEGVKQGISLGLGMWGDTWQTGKDTGFFSKETRKSALGSLGGTALLAGGASLLLYPLLKVGKSLFKGAGWLGSLLFGKKGKLPTTVPTTIPQQPKQPRQPKTQPKQPRPVIYDSRGKPIKTTPRQAPAPVPTQTSTTKPPKKQRWWSKLKPPKKPKKPKLPKMPKWLKKTGKFARRVPLLGAGLGALSILGSGKENLMSTIGEVVGGAAGGAAGGAVLGSVFPGVGTVVGGIGGGVLGAFGGGKAMDWAGGLFKGKKASAQKSETGGTRGADKPSGSPSTKATGMDMVSRNSQILATYLGQASGWVAGAFQPLQGVGQLIGHNATTLSTWLGQSSAWVVGAFQPLQGTGQMIGHNASVLSTWLAQSSAWVVGAFQPLQAHGMLAAHNLSALNTWLAQSSAWVAGAFSPLQSHGALTAQNLMALNTWLAMSSAWVVGAFQPIQGNGALINQNMSALSTWLGMSSAWVVGAFQPMQAGGQLVSHNLSALATWTAQASGWVVSGIQPIQSRGPLVSHNLSALATWLGRASGWVASINGIQAGAASVKVALNNLATRIRATNVPKISTPKLPSFRLPGFPRYAKGTNNHPGGPAIVGDGGGAELMQFPGGGMGLSPSTATMMNLPRGTKVMPHNKTKKLVDVPQYADGIGSINAVGGAVVYGDTNNSVGDINVTVVVEGGETENPELLGQKIANEVAGIIADKMEGISSNMPVSEV